MSLLGLLFTAQVLAGQNTSCVIRTESPVFPPYEWGAEKTGEVEVEVHLDADGSVKATVPETGDEFDAEAIRLARHAAFSAECYGKRFMLRFRFTFRDERETHRTAQVVVDAGDVITVSVNRPGSICDKPIYTEAEAAESYGRGFKLSADRDYVQAIRCLDLKTRIGARCGCLYRERDCAAKIGATGGRAGRLRLSPSTAPPILGGALRSWQSLS